MRKDHLDEHVCTKQTAYHCLVCHSAKIIHNLSKHAHKKGHSSDFRVQECNGKEDCYICELK